MSQALRRLLNRTYTTKRPPAMSSDKRAERGAYLSGVKGLPIDPADGRNEIVQSLVLNGPIELYQTVVLDVDILPGHALVDGSVEYTVRAVAPYDGPTTNRSGDRFKVLILERERR